MGLLGQFLYFTWCLLGSLTCLHSSASLARIQMAKKASLTWLAPQLRWLESLWVDWAFPSFCLISHKCWAPFSVRLLSLNRWARFYMQLAPTETKMEIACRLRTCQNGPASLPIYCVVESSHRSADTQRERNTVDSNSVTEAGPWACGMGRTGGHIWR